MTIKDGKGNQVGKPVVTDKNGGFTVPNLPDGDYVVVVDTPEGYNNPKPVVVPVKDGKPTTVPPFKADKPELTHEDKTGRAKPGSFQGWLVDDSGRQIPGAKLKLVKKGVTDPSTGKTFDYEVPLTVDADGFFVTPPIDFTYFPEGKADFDLVIDLPKGWPDKDVTGKPLNRTVTVESDKFTDIGEIRVKAPETQTIKGRVDDGNGKAVPGTVVVVTDPRGNSSVIPVKDDGTFEIPDAIPGVHEIEVLTPGDGRDTDPIKVPVRAGEDVKLPDIHLTKDASLKLEKRVWYRDANGVGKVKDADGNDVDDVMTLIKGEKLRYDFYVTNTGKDTLTDITLDDPEFAKRGVTPKLEMPAGWTATPKSLKPGEKLHFVGEIDAPEDAFDFNNVATANGKTSAGKAVGSAPDSAYAKFVDGSVEKKVNARFASNADDPVKMAADNALSFTYEVENTGSAPMVNVSLADVVYEDGVDEEKCIPVKVGEKRDGAQCYQLDVKQPEGFNGTLLPGQKVIFTADIPEGLKPGAKHHDAAEARGELPKRPNRGTQFDGEPDYGEDPSSELIISPRDNIKGNAHIIVDEGAPLAQDVYAVAWNDKNGNAKQDPGEGVSGLEITLVPTDGRPAVKGESNEDGNVRFESASYGEYYFEIKNPGNLRLADPADPNQNSFEAGTTLKSKTFEVGAEERRISLKLLTPSQADEGGAIIGGNGTATDKPATDVAQAEDGSSLGKCLATASSVNNPVAWLVPLGLLAAVMGGIGMRYEDELNAAAAQANEAVRRMMPNANLDINFQQPEWVTEAQAKWQAQINQVNAQLAEINPAAPAAAAGVGILAIAGLLTGLFYASCQLGWNEPSADGSSSSSSKKGEAEATGTEATETATTKEKRSIFGGSSKRDRGAKESEAAETKATETKATEAKATEAKATEAK